MAAAVPLVAAAASAISSYSSYQNTKAMGKQAQADADAQAAQGRLEAERILRQKERQQSAARAAAAANGLDVNEGTVIKINDETEQAGQYDAEMARINGYNASQRLQAQANQYQKNANTTLAEGMINTASTYAGWK